MTTVTTESTHATVEVYPVLSLRVREGEIYLAHCCSIMYCSGSSSSSSLYIFAVTVLQRA
jgi:hypothetical protein